MKPPSSPQGVKWFLGHITYMSKFISNLALESEPLQCLLSQDIARDFHWTDDQMNAFNRLKTLLTELGNSTIL